MSEQTLLKTVDEITPTNWPKITYEHALMYAGEFGWYIIPLHNPTPNGGCSCLNPDCSSIGKHPRTPNGLIGATNDSKTIRSWFRQWPYCNIGIVTGEISGICVLDSDGNIGKRSLLGQPPIPYTMTCKSGKGNHYFFKHPGVKVKTTTAVLPGLDSRGDGGYVCAVPSLHAKGYRYEWLDKGVIAPVPDWWMNLINNPVEIGLKDREEYQVRMPSTETTNLTSYANCAMQKELTVLWSTGEGGRNRQLVRSAFNLYQLVYGGILEENLVYNALSEAGIGIGLSASEVRTTINSAKKGAAKRPRSTFS